MGKSNLKSRPPKIDPQLEAFIQGAETEITVLKRAHTPTSISQKKIKDNEVFPWEEFNVRHDVKKLFSLRLSEPDMLKLKYIQEKTGKSMQKFCLEHILPEIEAEVKRLKSNA